MNSIAFICACFLVAVSSASAVNLYCNSDPYCANPVAYRDGQPVILSAGAYQSTTASVEVECEVSYVPSLKMFSCASDVISLNYSATPDTCNNAYLQYNPVCADSSDNYGASNYYYDSQANYLTCFDDYRSSCQYITNHTALPATVSGTFDSPLVVVNQQAPVTLHLNQTGNGVQVVIYGSDFTYYSGVVTAGMCQSTVCPSVLAGCESCFIE